MKFTDHFHLLPDPFQEDDKYYPNSPYSASKASSDLLVRSFYKTYNLPTIVSNCSNNYGPYQSLEKFIPLIIFNALNKKNIPIYGKMVNRFVIGYLLRIIVRLLFKFY